VSLVSLLILLAALMASTVILLLVLAAIWWFDRYDREPLHIVAAVFGWGALIAPPVAITALSVFGSALASSAPSDTLLFIWMMGAAPVVEELVKAVAVLLVVVLTAEFDNPTDGVVYGTAVGLGFAVTENAIYGLSAAAGGAYDGLGVLIVVGGRTVLTAGVHAVCSATLGGFLGHALLSGSRRGRVSLTLMGLLAAILLHTTWNLALFFFGAAGETGLPRAWLAVLPLLYGVFVAVLAAFLRSEHRILKTQLEEEVDLGLAPGWVPEVIPYYRRRVRPDWWPVRSERTVIARLLTRLAFRKHALGRLPADRGAVASLEIVKLRQRVREIFEPRSESDEY